MSFAPPLTLVRRSGLPPAVKRLSDGPVPGGRFWALQGAHDLPGDATEFASMLLADVFAQGGRVWVALAGTENWQEIFSENSLPKFEVSVVDDYDAVRTEMVVRPFMPQFYVIGIPDQKMIPRCNNCGHWFKKRIRTMWSGDSDCPRCGRGTIRMMAIRER